MIKKKKIKKKFQIKISLYKDLIPVIQCNNYLIIIFLIEGLSLFEKKKDLIELIFEALYKLVEYRNLDFYPSFSAFTFPFVISTIATKGVLITVGSNMALSLILTFETIISIVLVFYVLSEYMRFLKK